jgi:uracil-DNA glycosylase
LYTTVYICCLGVLLLNACLTVKAANANSHQGKGWEELTDAVIKWISENSTGVVFLLWGSYAQKKASSVDKVNMFLEIF